MDPSKPNEPTIDQGMPIPRSRPGDGANPQATHPATGTGEVLEGEILGRDAPLGRPGPTTPQPPKTGLGLRRTLVLILISVTLLVCLGGSLTAYLLYDKTTTPERGTPAVSLQQYIAAKFNRRDEMQVQSFECKQSHLQPIDELLNQIKAREKETGTGFTVTPSGFSVSQTKTSATIRGDLSIATQESDGTTSRVIQHWQFELTEDGGWRVCGATRLG